jgi:hypothetical protein
MNWKRLIPSPSTVTPVVTLVFCAYLIASKIELAAPDQLASTAGSYASSFEVEASKAIVSDTRADISMQLDMLNLTLQVQELIETSEFKQARTILLQMAAHEVQQGNKKRLANIMLLLGKVATNDTQLDAAEVYLLEALDIADQAGDTLTVAKTYQQLGKLHIRSRELARRAGYAHDNLWVIRNQINRGEYRDVEDGLRQVIDANLTLQRYAAAASAYQTLADYHASFHDSYQAQAAAREAANLYASSGQLKRARQIIAELERDGVPSDALLPMQNEVDEFFQNYQYNNALTAQAHDYQMLYHYYQSRGEHHRAWKLRIQASKALAGTSERSVYQRKADVMAVLYNSNFAMKKARNYLGKASKLFATQGEDDLYLSTLDMGSLIY